MGLEKAAAEQIVKSADDPQCTMWRSNIEKNESFWKKKKSRNKVNC